MDNGGREAGEVPEAGPGSRLRRRYFLIACALFLLGVVIVFRAVLLPFALAVVIAYVLSPIADAGQRLVIRGRHLPRWVVVLVIYLLLLGALAGLLAIAVPRLLGEINNLAAEAPKAVATVRDQWLPEIERRVRTAVEPYLQRNPEGPEVQAAPAEGLPAADHTPGAVRIQRRYDGSYDILLPPDGLMIKQEGEQSYRLQRPSDTDSPDDFTSSITGTIAGAMENTQQTAIAVLQTAQALVIALTRGIFVFFITLMISAYLLITSRRIFDFLRSFYRPERRDDFDTLVRRVDNGLAGVVRGQLMICAVNGVLSAIGFYILGLKYWIFLSLIAAIGSLVPIFGTILSSVPAVIVGLSQSFMLALGVLAWIVVIHQIEANVLNPKIMGDAARVHPVLVVFALLAGEHVGGIVGALLAVPVLSITQTLFFHLRERALGIRRAAS